MRYKSTPVGSVRLNSFDDKRQVDRLNLELRRGMDSNLKVIIDKIVGASAMTDGEGADAKLYHLAKSRPGGKDYSVLDSVLEGLKHLKDVTPSNVGVPAFDTASFRWLLGEIWLDGRELSYAAVVGNRGVVGTRRSVCLQNIKIFGTASIITEHTWIPCNKIWDRAEPLVQGNKVFMMAKVEMYVRDSGAADFSLVPSKIIKL